MKYYRELHLTKHSKRKSLGGVQRFEPTLRYRQELLKNNKIVIEIKNWEDLH